MLDPGKWRASIEGLTFARINDGEASNLERPFTEEEVFLALANLNGDKPLVRMVLHWPSSSLAGR